MLTPQNIKTRVFYAAAAGDASAAVPPGCCADADCMCAFVGACMVGCVRARKSSHASIRAAGIHKDKEGRRAPIDNAEICREERETEADVEATVNLVVEGGPKGIQAARKTRTGRTTRRPPVATFQPARSAPAAVGILKNPGVFYADPPKHKNLGFYGVWSGFLRT